MVEASKIQAYYDNLRTQGIKPVTARKLTMQNFGLRDLKINADETVTFFFETSTADVGVADTSIKSSKNKSVGFYSGLNLEVNKAIEAVIREANYDLAADEREYAARQEYQTTQELATEIRQKIKNIENTIAPKKGELANRKNQVYDEFKKLLAFYDAQLPTGEQDYEVLENSKLKELLDELQNFIKIYKLDEMKKNIMTEAEEIDFLLQESAKLNQEAEEEDSEEETDSEEEEEENEEEENEEEEEEEDDDEEGEEEENEEETDSDDSEEEKLSIDKSFYGFRYKGDVCVVQSTEYESAQKLAAEILSKFRTHEGLQESPYVITIGLAENQEEEEDEKED